MAESKAIMGRLGRLERDVGELKEAVVQIGAILVDQSERMDSGFRSLREEIGSLREEFGPLRREVGSLHEEFGSLRERLDRLIAVTIEERTLGAARLLDIERRVSKLEERMDEPRRDS
jgi:predicted nuclease with TOPRIM domain